MEASFAITPDIAAELAAELAAKLDMRLDPAAAAGEGAAVPLPEPDLHYLAARTALFSPGEDAGKVYEVTQGVLMITRLLPDGRRQILDIAGAGRVIGLTWSDAHDCAAIALRDSIVRRHDSNGSSAVALNAARFADALFGEVHRLRNLATALGRKTATERLAGFLLDLAGEDADPPVRIDLPVTRNEIADHLGLALETVSRTFSRLRRDGIMRIETSQKLTILDRAALRRLADGGPF
ncbi:helix-turn-helix domain-containing protein [Rhodoblastus sp. 17X3]|uniref:helix-turn-helix domain-containing protein n=1 Tax=Rhodoblastus sp. 17X3 TaxID=3047026 RepID=UPI0024B80F80|nr:helix-turn-helix domain-containing protein [Rhodoblastus sp. 17X3]MDI9848956.1 helix-turn-helix domain-containing protein [Rhodoblastus sp. 17X3]